MTSKEEEAAGVEAAVTAVAVNSIGNMNDKDDNDEYIDNVETELRDVRQRQGRSRFPWFHFVSNVMFVTASALYLWMAVRDFEWSEEVVEFPIYLRTVTDDEPWQEYRYDQWRTGRDSVSAATEQAMTTLEIENEVEQNEDIDIEAKDPSIYYDEWWADLPPETQEAYEVLGYNEVLWNTGEELEIYEMDWNDISLEQQNALTFLGYTELSWNGSEGYDDYDWDELPKDIKQAAIALGYDQEMWDNSGIPETEDYWWHELSQEQQDAAALMGYDEYSWDGTEPPTVTQNELGELVITGATSPQTDNFDDFHLWEDDSVFVIGTDIYVTKYQIIYFCAALLFVLVGVLDLLRERKMFHMLMIFAGLNGLVSAIFAEEDVYLSNVFSAVSVHCFFLEACSMLTNHSQMRAPFTGDKDSTQNWLMKVLAVADVMFLIGAFLDVLLSYFWLLDDTADWDTALQGTGILAATVWLLCPLIYLFGTLYVYFAFSDEHVDNTSVHYRKEEETEQGASAKIS